MPGKFVVERPTLICLGFEWQISGDDNRNATVHLDYTVPEMFAGSILDLDPDTEYEAHFQMRDPDGMRGEAVRTVKVRTRGEPKAAAGGRVWKGEKKATGSSMRTTWVRGAGASYREH